MHNEDRERLLGELIEKPEERAKLLQSSGLDARENSEISALVETADLLWLSAHDAPPLQDDPVAGMLGLVPDHECTLDSKALSRSRKRAGLTVSELAAKLRDRGWEIKQSEVFRWETRSASDVAPAVVQSISSVLSTPVDRLISAPRNSGAQDYLAQVRQSPLFKELVNRWARALNVSPAVAVAGLESRMAATVHRGAHPDSEQLLRSLEVLVASVEQDGAEQEPS